MVKMKNLFWLQNALKMQTSNKIYLFMASFNIKYAIYIVELEAIKASGGKGSPSQSVSHHCRSNISCVRQEQRTRSRTLQSIVNSKHSSFSRQKIDRALSVQSTSSVQIEVAFFDYKRSHYVIMFNIYIIVFQARDCPAD
jgi:hypothetical protein